MLNDTDHNSEASLVSSAPTFSVEPNIWLLLVKSSFQANNLHFLN